MADYDIEALSLTEPKRQMLNWVEHTFDMRLREND
jgi:hypothetical protein